MPRLPLLLRVARRAVTCVTALAALAACGPDTPLAPALPPAGVPRLDVAAVSDVPTRPDRLAAGVYHTCAVTSGGAIACWGEDQYGEAAPLRTATTGTYVGVGAGWMNTCALTSAGTVECWGNNRLAQAPAIRTAASGTYTALGVGWFHACAVTSAGAAECWGDGGDDKAPATRTATSGTYTAVTAGAYHTCALTSAGTVECWGANSRGQAPATRTAASGTYVALSAGSTHTCAVTSSGTAECWGYDWSGQAPATRTAASGTYIAISAGSSRTCALTSAGGAECWGYDASGAASATRTPAAGAYTVIAVNTSQSCAATTTGAVECWGSDVAAGSATPPPGLNLITQPQTIAFTSEPPSPAVVGGTYVLSAAGGPSGNPVLFSSRTPSVCTITGDTATFAAPGSCTVAADQAGNVNYYAAPALAQTIVVELRPQAIAFTSAPPVPARVGGTYVPAAAGGTSDNPVTFSSLTPAVCTLADGTVTFVAAGTCTVAADQAGSDVHAAAPQVTQSVEVAAPREPQTITFADRLQDEIGVLGVFTLVRTTGGASGQPVVLTSRTPGTCTVGAPSRLGTPVRFVAIGACTIAADQAGTASHAPAPTVTQTMRVVYPFVGFLPPVAGGLLGSSTVNVVAAGKGVPLRFTLAGHHGLGILSGSPTSTAVACPSRPREQRVTETVSASASGLAYDARKLQYTYTWKTEAAWAGTCRRFTLALNDGTTQSATFRFTR